MLEWLLEIGYFRGNVHVAASGFRDFASFGRLELMEQILQQHPTLADDDVYWLQQYWGEAQENACKCGNLKVLTWLIEHPIGRKQCEKVRTIRHIDRLLRLASVEGHIDIVQYLHGQGAVDTNGTAVMGAIRRGHKDVVEFLMEPYSDVAQMKGAWMVNEAVRAGQVKMLSLFQKFSSPALAVPPLKCKRKQIGENQWWSDVGYCVNLAAMRGHLDVLEWFQMNRSLKASPGTMDDAAALGHLEIVKWLHSVRAEKCSSKAMDRAASAGHLVVVQWLPCNRSEGCTCDAMDSAAGHGHLEVVKWLHYNRTEGCTTAAMDKDIWRLYNGCIAIDTKDVPVRLLQMP
ncbi:unnamed protein product [Phytophthora fragariaefolia]|uniref:Unnamed protein product n=1 Tax=Phytophthora fragariaefolia TaxID=1490495 RepID=A0A9W6U451_9STRA|nr:unnamed protein product [Phytophthora fragariaefolia]